MPRYYQNLLHRYLVFKPKLTVLSTRDSDFLYPGGVGGRECKVEKSGTRVTQAWSERQDQILRNIVDPYRGNIMPWKLLAKTLTEHIPGKSLMSVKHRWNRIK